MKRAMASVTPAFSSHRMVRDYVEEIYLHSSLPVEPSP
jgi:hypothetical protein